MSKGGSGKSKRRRLKGRWKRQRGFLMINNGSQKDGRINENMLM